MASKVRVRIDVETEVGQDNKESIVGSIEFDTTTNRIKVTGEVYPWVIRAMMDFIDNSKDLLEKPKKR